MRLWGVLVFLQLANYSACSLQTETPPVVIQASEQVSGPEAEVAAIYQTAERMLSALKDQDLDTLMDGFAENAVLIHPGQPVLEGKASIRIHYRAQFQRFKLEEIGPTLDELVICGEWAFSRGSAVVLGTEREHGKSVQVFNRGIEIWRKQSDGTWKLARAIGNASRH